MAVGWGSGTVLDRDAARTAWVAAPSLAPLEPHEQRPRPSRGRGPAPSHHPEIDCIRGLVAPAIVAIAEQRAAEADIGADRVLIAWGAISEETYVAALAEWLGMPFEPLDHVRRGQCPASEQQLIQMANTGLLPMPGRDGLQFVVAPRLVDSRRLIELAKSGAEPGGRLRLTSTARLRSFVERHTAREIGYRAVDELHDRNPEMSARTAWPPIATLASGAAVIALAGFAAPDATLAAFEAVFGLVFMAWTGLRVLGLLTEHFIRPRPRILTDDRLPIYTIIIALYQETAAVPGLVAALADLNYPLEKLDLKFVIEPDDRETRRALERLRFALPFEIVVAPNRGPRTKPKALNAALPFARGSFLVIFDAEDRPEREQLRLALDAFVSGSERLACVQARLCIDNTADSWLTRLFTAEYAGLFDVFLPGLAAWQLPLPLGGSSNHFRTAVLRRIGAWDPYNVTEDADLGMRLARFGYATTVIPSTTYEEAPAKFRAWLHQRTRWFKGWMQTWQVHMRSPLRLARQLGLPGFAAFQLVVGGTVLASLVHVLFFVQLVFNFATAPLEDSAARLLLGLYTVMLLSGYAASALLAFVGLLRRGLIAYAWALVLIPVYWLILSLAAWRALLQLLFDPYRWEKTAHGLARTSRLAAKRQR